MDQIVEQPRGRRKSSLACMAQIISALLVCGEQDAQTLSLKSGVSDESVKRSLKVLVIEGLVVRELTKVHPQKYMYKWIGKS